MSLNVQEIPLQKLREFAEGGYLYAILDATDAPLVPPRMQELGEKRAVSLFKGTAQEEYWAVAPYLVAVDVTVLRWIYENLWEQPWGIFALAKVPIEELRNHFRKFLIVTLPDEKQWFFRYYDPRVLKTFLGNCTEEELTDFLGPVRAIGIMRSMTLEAVASAGSSVPGPAAGSAMAAELVLLSR